MITTYRRRTGKSPARTQQGMTLIEIMLVVALLGLIAVPLGMVFLTVVRSNSSAEDRFSRSGEAQRIGEAWTRDVQSVEPGGVNGPGPNDHCGTTDQSPSYSDADELRRVSFNWDFSARDEGASTVRRTATWVVKGPDQGPYQLLRRYCEDLFPVQERVLAKDMTASGLTKAMAVRGPGNPTQDFCPADGDGVRRKCTIVVGGGYDYQLTVTRRVPDYSTATVTQYAPGAPTAISHDARNGYLNVYWTPPAMGVGQTPVTSYRLELRSGSATGSIVRTIDPAANGTGRQSLTVDTLTNGTNYYVTLRAANAQGLGDPTVPYGPMTPVPTGPEPPTITNVVANPNGSVTVTWSHNSNDGGGALTSWSIWAVKDGDDPAVAANLIGPTRPTPDGAGTSGTVTSGLTGFQRYRFIVADHNAVGEGFRSEPSDAVMAYANAVFVKNSTGTDSGLCGSIAAPCKTVNQALFRATGLTNPIIALAGGETYSRFTLTQGVTVWGGFSADFSSTTSALVSTISDGTYSNEAGAYSGIDFYSAASTASTVKNLRVQRSARNATTPTYGIDVNAATAGLTLDGVTVEGGEGLHPTGIRIRSNSVVSVTQSTIASGAALGSTTSAYGIRALTGSTLTLTSSTVTASGGTQGVTGATGAAASTTGCGGLNGSGSSGAGTQSGCSGGAFGGAGGSGSSGGAGGNGGNGQTLVGTGSPGVGGTGGSGVWSCPTPTGANGAGGSTGAGGGGGPAGGAGAPASGTIGATLGAEWSSAVGGTGGTGATGGGGGGGGGGGAGDRSRRWNIVFCSTHAGGGGGGGGGGGKVGGTGGAGGQIGGGSFAVYAKGATVVVRSSTLTTAKGGKGGTGGQGGTGSSGGVGGNGATGLNGSGLGGRGAGGGGAGGGGGGAGGQGGASIAVLGIQPGVVIDVDGSNTFSVGAGGDGGTGGGGGSGGSGGAAGTDGSGSANAGNIGSTGTTGSTGSNGARCGVWAGTSCTVAAA